MEQNLRLRHLVEAQRQIAESSARIARQHQLIEELERNGHDTFAARELLETFLDAHELHERDRERIRAVLFSPPAARPVTWLAPASLQIP
jgi:hypothetical protein